MEYGDVDNGRALLEALLRKRLFMGFGGEETLTEYKALFPPEDWEAVRDSLFDSFEPDSYAALQLYASEGCLDRKFRAAYQLKSALLEELEEF